MDLTPVTKTATPSAPADTSAIAGILPWQRAPWARFAERSAAGTVPHAILLHGPAGTGKYRFAWALVRRLLCSEVKAGEACGHCRSCTLAHPGGAHPDLVHVTVGEDRQQILVEQIRELGAALMLAPALGGRRVALLEPAGSMNRNAANALLKTLEEPGPDSHLILLADRLDRLPATILSRCQSTHLAPPPPAEGSAWLAGECPGSDPGERELALDLAGGAPLLAKILLAGNVPHQARQLAADLDRLAAGQADLTAVQAAWSQWPADRLWATIGHLLHRRAAAEPEGIWRAVPLCHLLRMYQAAVQQFRLASTPVRHDLQIWDWLLQWGGHSSSG